MPYSEHFDDIYFSNDDGMGESCYVFLEKNNLPHAWHKKNNFVICETGFGTGRNFLNTWVLFDKTTTKNQKLHYYSFEKFPLSPTPIHEYLSPWAGIFGNKLQQLIDEYPPRIGGWHTVKFGEQITLTLIFDDMNRAIQEMNTGIDCWFLDGHAPAKNADMWSDNLFENMGRLSNNGASFATYTAASFIRNGLKQVGFDVSKTRGFGRKAEMNIGKFIGNNNFAHPNQSPPKNVAIIGAGIAGTVAANELMNRNINVELYDKNGIGTCASGNMRGLFNPRFAANIGFDYDFYGAAFARAIKLFQKTPDIDYNPCGSLHLITDDAKDKRFSQIIDNWKWHADHLQMVDAQSASDIAGIKLNHAALYLPDAGYVAPFKVCGKLAENINFNQYDINEIYKNDAGWMVDGKQFDAVIIAGGMDICKFTQTAHLPIQTVRGQVSIINTPTELKKLKTNLCYGGYTTPNMGDKMVVGSTFQHWLDTPEIRNEDHIEILNKLQNVTGKFTEEPQVIGGKVGFRAAARDRTPIIGKIDDGLYISGAHGSHGLLSAGMGGALIAADLCGENQILPKSVIDKLSPKRF